MSEIIYTRVYPEPPVDRREILRYAGVREGGEELHSVLEELLSLSLPTLSYKVCYTELPLCRDGDMLDLGFAKVSSHSLGERLLGCERVVLFAATVGLGIDRIILRYGRLSESRALLAQAIGTERAEALCDTFCAELGERYESEGYFTAPRFSVGYGDLPLELQRDIFATLQPQRHIGLTLGESLIMSPSKSVTAIVGIGKRTG